MKKVIVSVALAQASKATGYKIEIEVKDDITEEDLEEICRETAFEEFDWNYYIKEQENG